MSQLSRRFWKMRWRRSSFSNLRQLQKRHQMACWQLYVAFMLLMASLMPGPDIDEIATFIRVVRQGSLAGAARELELPKSTVSRRVSRLEERLHVELLYRSNFFFPHNIHS